MDCGKIYYLFNYSLHIFLVALYIRNLVVYRNLCITGHYKWYDAILICVFIMNYCIYFILNMVSYTCQLITNQITDLEMIKKIQNIIEDNSFGPSIISYECSHIVGADQKLNNKGNRYVDKDEFVREISKADTLTYNYKSMRDISGKINFNTTGYKIISLNLSIQVLMDQNTLNDYNKTKDTFLNGLKDKDEYFETNFINHYLDGRPLYSNYLVKVNGGKCGCILNFYLYLILTIFGFAFIFKLIIWLCLNDKQRITIKKIISSKFDVNDPEIERTFGYDQLTPKFYINNIIIDNYLNELTPSDYNFDKKENLLP